MKHYALFLHIPSTGGARWELWTAGKNDDQCIARGVGHDVTQAMIGAGAAVVGEKK
jgi:hypothetical protein